MTTRRRGRRRGPPRRRACRARPSDRRENRRDASSSASSTTASATVPPSRRKGYTQKAVVGGHKVYLRTGEYEDGRLGEIFIDMHKEAAPPSAPWMNNFAISISPSACNTACRSTNMWRPSPSPASSPPAWSTVERSCIKNATSILDYVFRELAVSYLDRDDLAHVSADASNMALGKGVAEDAPIRAGAPAPAPAPVPAQNVVSPRHDARQAAGAEPDAGAGRPDRTRLQPGGLLIQAEHRYSGAEKPRPPTSSNRASRLPPSTPARSTPSSPPPLART